MAAELGYPSVKFNYEMSSGTINNIDNNRQYLFNMVSVGPCYSMNPPYSIIVAQNSL